MKFRQGDEVTLRGVVTHPDIGGKVYVDVDGFGIVTTDLPSTLTLVNRRYQVGDVVEARSGQPPGPHEVLGVHEGDLWTLDPSGAHVILVGNTVLPYIAPLADRAEVEEAPPIPVMPDDDKAYRTAIEGVWSEPDNETTKVTLHDLKAPPAATDDMPI